MIGILNAHMFGSPSVPGEHVDWSEPDIMTEAEWCDMLGTSVAEYAASAPHMIVFEVGDGRHTTCPDCGRREGWDGHAYGPCSR